MDWIKRALMLSFIVIALWLIAYAVARAFGWYWWLSQPIIVNSMGSIGQFCDFVAVVLLIIVMLFALIEHFARIRSCD